MNAVGAVPVLVFSDRVLQPVLLYWYDVYNPYLGGWEAKKQQQCLLSSSSPRLSPSPYFRAEWILNVTSLYFL